VRTQIRVNTDNGYLLYNGRDIVHSGFNEVRNTFEVTRPILFDPLLFLKESEVLANEGTKIFRDRIEWSSETIMSIRTNAGSTEGPLIDPWSSPISRSPGIGVSQRVLKASAKFLTNFKRCSWVMLGYTEFAIDPGT